MQRAPSLTVSVNITATNPDSTTSYVNVNDQLSIVDQVGGPTLAAGSTTSTLRILDPGFSGPVRFNFTGNPVFNNATYTSTATVSGVKTPPPYHIGAGPAPIATNTKTEKVSWA